MIAGTLALLEESADEALESAYRGQGLPGLDVSEMQETLDGERTIQSGQAADIIHDEAEVPVLGYSPDSDEPTGITTELREDSRRVLVDWVADVTGSGLIVASTTEGDSSTDFPWDLFWAQCESEPKVQQIDIESLFRDWDRDGALGDIWLNAADAGDGSTIGYHANATDDQPATIGLGFTRPWGGTVFEGVVYESGYLALYDCNRPVEFVQFVEDEILPYCSTPESAEQALLSEVGDDSDDDVPTTCEDCGRESDTIEDGICIVCLDKREEESETTIEVLDTVTETGGD